MLSSQHDVVEISNSYSSDDDLPAQSPPPSLNNVVSFQSNSNPTSKVAASSSSVKDNKRYSSKFNKDWLSNPNFSKFLRECKNDPTKALCIFCNIKFSIQNSGIGDINRHIQRNKHQECSKSAEANRCKNTVMDLTNKISLCNYFFISKNH